MCVLRATHELFNFIDDFTVLPISTYMLPSKFTAQNLVRMHLMLKLISIPTAAFTIVFLGSQNSHGQSTSSPNSLSEIYACADIADSTARLACYDASVGRLETAEKSGDIVTLSRSTIFPPPYCQPRKPRSAVLACVKVMCMMCILRVKPLTTLCQPNAPWWTHSGQSALWRAHWE